MITSPIIFENKMGEELNTQEYVGSFNNTNCQINLGKIQEADYIARIEVEKNRSILKNRFLNQINIQHMKNKCNVYRDLSSNVIYESPAGDLIYSIISPDNREILSRVLLNVKNYQSYVYFSNCQQVSSVMKIKWIDEKMGKEVFCYLKMDISISRFLRKIKESGVSLLVASRIEMQAASVLWDYTIRSATEIELPYSMGWYKNQKGVWQFAKEDTLTMKEVIERC